jgi:uncharacterized protein (DUF302 family)
MSYGISIRTQAPFAEAVARVREALKAQGFGVLTEIDMRATLRDKLGQDMEDYLILGACNPPLACQALGVDSSIGLLLPCNVVVRTHAPAGRRRGRSQAQDSPGIPAREPRNTLNARHHMTRGGTIGSPRDTPWG